MLPLVVRLVVVVMVLVLVLVLVLVPLLSVAAVLLWGTSLLQ